VTLPKPRLVKVAPAVWQCRSIEFIGAGMSPKVAYENWQAWMREDRRQKLILSERSDRPWYRG
jgi:hypothetical protein